MYFVYFIAVYYIRYSLYISNNYLRIQSFVVFIMLHLCDHLKRKKKMSDTIIIKYYVGICILL